MPHCAIYQARAGALSRNSERILHLSFRLWRPPVKKTTCILFTHSIRSREKPG